MTFHRRRKATSVFPLSHRATRGLRLHQLYVLPLAMMRLCATQCEGGGGVRAWGQWRANPAGKSEHSLCMIQYHACVPMNGCQDILRSEPRNEPRTEMQKNTGRVAERCEAYTLKQIQYIPENVIKKEIS